MLGPSQLSFEFLDRFRVFVFGREHAHWDLDALGLFRVDHGRMDFGRGAEKGAALRRERDNLRTD